MFSFPRAQTLMQEDSIDSWLLCDYRGSNPMFRAALNMLRDQTRRAFLFIPASGAPILLINIIDQAFFEHITITKQLYATWQEMRGSLAALLAGTARLAMDYSPNNDLPAAAFADAGTVEYFRSQGHDIVSSADLYQAAAMIWDETAIASHKRAAALVAATKDAAFDLVAAALREGRTITEYQVQRFIAAEFGRLGLETEGVPVVQVNEHSGTPFYEPTAEHSSIIQPGDWLLIDIWAREPGEQNVHADIAWGTYAGYEVPVEIQKVFDIVRTARDAAVEHVRQAWQSGETLLGWQLDHVAHDIIIQHGYGDYVRHRTGHSMGPGRRLHGLGANIDDFESHDTRRILPGLGFSIEPGIYLPKFGVRSEINVYLDPASGPFIATPLQTEIRCLLAP